jgi:transcriptional regulator with PAS, ATPase and Fis domain
MVETGGFRLDLFYRISPIVIELPSLRERLDDIPLLVAKFLSDFAFRHGRPVPGISAEALAELAERPWPGNIRQLQHELERALVFSDGVMIGVDNLSEVPKRSQNAPMLTKAQDRPRELKHVISEIQNEQIREAIAASGGNKKQAAANLGISRSFLYKRLSEIEGQKI